MKERELENNNCVGRAMLDTCFLFDWCYYLSQLLPQPVHGYIYGTEKNVQCEAAPHRLELGQTNALPFTKGNIWFCQLVINFTYLVNWLSNPHNMSSRKYWRALAFSTKRFTILVFLSDPRRKCDIILDTRCLRLRANAKWDEWISTKIESSQENTLDLHPATRR